MLILALPLAARAEWPERPIKIIVPFPAGNSSDVSMRLLGEKLSTRLGQPVIIDNKVGAGGTIGTDFRPAPALLEAMQRDDRIWAAAAQAGHIRPQQ